LYREADDKDSLDDYVDFLRANIINEEPSGEVKTLVEIFDDLALARTSEERADSRQRRGAAAELSAHSEDAPEDEVDAALPYRLHDRDPNERYKIFIRSVSPPYEQLVAVAANYLGVEWHQVQKKIITLEKTLFFTELLTS